MDICPERPAPLRHRPRTVPLGDDPRKTGIDALKEHLLIYSECVDRAQASGAYVDRIRPALVKSSVVLGGDRCVAAGRFNNPAGTTQASVLEEARGALPDYGPVPRRTVIWLQDAPRTRVARSALLSPPIGSGFRFRANHQEWPYNFIPEFPCGVDRRVQLQVLVQRCRIFFPAPLTFDTKVSHLDLLGLGPRAGTL